MYQHLMAEPEVPSRKRSELANWAGLDALVLMLLAKDREQRPKDVAEVLRLAEEVKVGRRDPCRTIVQVYEPTPLDEVPRPTFLQVPRVWGITSTLRAHAEAVQSLAFSPDGRILA